jgi:hypothetical protein
MVIVYVMRPGYPAPSVARTATVEVPSRLVGVPESRPPEESVRPAGSVPLYTVKVQGPAPPLAVICWL